MSVTSWRHSNGLLPSYFSKNLLVVTMNSDTLPRSISPEAMDLFMAAAQALSAEEETPASITLIFAINRSISPWVQVM